MTTTINPVVQYRDLAQGVRYLIDTFGFTEIQAHRGDDGGYRYAELAFDGAPLGIGPTAEGSMFDLGPTSIYLAVDEVDSIHERAVAAGAEIAMPPTDQDYGSRDFVARDHEGNLWCFGTFRPGATAPA